MRRRGIRRNLLKKSICFLWWRGRGTCWESCMLLTMNPKKKFNMNSNELQWNVMLGFNLYFMLYKRPNQNQPRWGQIKVRMMFFSAHAPSCRGHCTILPPAFSSQERGNRESEEKNEGEDAKWDVKTCEGSRWRWRAIRDEYVLTRKEWWGEK